MRPKKHEATGSGDLFRARLDQIINMRHELVQLAGKIDWDFIDGEIAPLYSDSGRPGIATQFVIGLFLLKHIYGLLLAESLRVAHESGALRTKDLARVTVDTTVQPKDITFPTDAKLLHAAIKG